MESLCLILMYRSLFVFFSLISTMARFRGWLDNTKCVTISSIVRTIFKIERKKERNVFCSLLFIDKCNPTHHTDRSYREIKDVMFIIVTSTTTITIILSVSEITRFIEYMVSVSTHSLSIKHGRIS